MAETTLIDTGNFSVAMVIVPQISTGDTVTLNDFTQIVGLVTCLADFSQIPSWTNQLNTITLATTGLINVRVVLFAMGKR